LCSPCCRARVSRVACCRTSSRMRSATAPGESGSSACSFTGSTPRRSVGHLAYTRQEETTVLHGLGRSSEFLGTVAPALDRPQALPHGVRLHRVVPPAPAQPPCSRLRRPVMAPQFPFEAFPVEGHVV